MDTKYQRWFAWSAVPFVLIYIIGFVGLSGFVPPHSPLMTGSELVAMYEQNRFGIRAGQLICLIMSAFILLWSAVISAQMARIEKGRLPMLSLTQFIAGALLSVLFMSCSLIWSFAAFREDVSPEILRMLDDAAWLVFVMAYPEYVVQLICIALVGFSDKRPQPFMPRWACYATLWVAFCGTGGGFSTFFKTGPFAWNGILGFWLPIGIFIPWLLFVMLPLLLKVIRRQELEEAAE